MSHIPGNGEPDSADADGDPILSVPAKMAPPRVALFQEVPGGSGQVLFRYTGHGKPLWPALVALSGAMAGLVGTLKAARLGQMSHPMMTLLGCGLGLVAAGILGFVLRELWTHQIMVIDPASGTLRIRIRTPFRSRIEEHAVAHILSVLVCPPPDGPDQHRVTIEMKNGASLDLGRGPRPEAVTVGRRIASLLNRPFRLS